MGVTLQNYFNSNGTGQPRSQGILPSGSGEGGEYALGSAGPFCSLIGCKKIVD